jgi:uncharacterized membrane protein YesL
MTPVSHEEERYSEVGAGPLSRWSAAVYWAVVVELLVVLTSLPGIVGTLLLGGSASNLPLVTLCLLPVGPSLSAAVFAWRDWLDAGPDRDLTPAKHFLRGYRLNWRDVLLWWVPTVVVLAVLTFNATHATGAFTLVSVVVAAALLVWAGNALVLSSLFAFRTRDVARLAVFYVAVRPVAALGVLALLVVVAGLALAASDWLVVVMASVLVLLLVRNARPVVEDATKRFTAPA